MLTVIGWLIVAIVVMSLYNRYQIYSFDKELTQFEQDIARFKEKLAGFKEECLLK